MRQTPGWPRYFLALAVAACNGPSAASATNEAVPASGAAASASEASSTPEPSPPPSATPEVESAVIDADGWVAYQGGGGFRDVISLVRTDGSDEHAILADMAGDQRHPDFSRDGASLAFDALPSDSGADELWVAAADGSDARKVVDACPIDNCLGLWEPAWSPDGSKLAVTSFIGPFINGAPATSGIAVVDVTSKRVESIVEMPMTDGQVHFPRWSPDGRRLVFWLENPTPTIWVVDADGRTSPRPQIRACSRATPTGHQTGISSSSRAGLSSTSKLARRTCTR